MQRIILKKFAKSEFKFSSSGEVIKSIKIAGTTRAKGVPFIIIATLPESKLLQTLSGLSVAKV